MTRTLLTGGSVFDGTGSEGSSLDLMIEDDRISAVSTRIEPSPDVRVIDVKGKVVTPGFIDLHSHADFSILAFPDAQSALLQGITTIATGNCGGGVAPIASEDALRKVAFAYDPSWEVEVDWATFGEYAHRLDGAAVNVAPLVAHGPIRNSVMGMTPREPTQDEQQAMNDLLRQCLEEGAFGLSSGLEYEPGKWASPAEIESLVGVVGREGRLYATHMRDRADRYVEATAEALTASMKGNARLQLSHFAPRPHAPSETANRAFDLVEEAFGGGFPIGIDTFPEVWGPALLIDLFPEWSLEGSPSEVLDRLSDPDARQKISRHFQAADSFLVRAAGYEEIYIADAPGAPELSGVSLVDIDHTQDVGTAATEVLLGAGVDFRSVAIRHVYATEADLRRVIAMPNCSFESDGVVTSGEDEACRLLWNASSYGYTARVIEHYVGAEAFLTMAEAVRKMTSLPARALGISDRGELRPGAVADIVVIDPQQVADRTTPNTPARHPRGIEHVFVNGVLAVENTQYKGVRAGQLLKPQ